MFKGGTTFEKVGFDGESFQFIIDEGQIIFKSIHFIHIFFVKCAKFD